MKHTKRLLTALLALLVLCALMVPAMAADTDPSITITNDNTSVSMLGHTYNAYRVMDLTYDGSSNYSYTINSDFAAFFTAQSITTNAAAIEYIEAQSSNMQTFAAALLSYVKANAITAKGSATADAQTVTITPDALGYYLVTDAGTDAAEPSAAEAVVAALALTTTDYAGAIALKADAPTVSKTITSANVVNSGKTNTASIGDTVSFQITSSVPDMTGYAKYFFVINDTLSKGLTYAGNPVITVGTKTLTADEYTIETATDAITGVTTLTVALKNFVQYAKDAAITMTYDATVDTDAEVGSTANTNNVTITYSNDPTVTATGDPENTDKPGNGDVTGETPKSTTETFVTSVTISKIDGNDAPLTGAEFTLTGTAMNIVLVTEEQYTEDAAGTYYKLTDGTYTTAAPTEETANQYASTTILYTKETVLTAKGSGQTDAAVKGMVDANGQITFQGLGVGTYTITESVTPTGYNSVDPIELTIGFTAATKTFTVTGGNATVGADNLVAMSVTNLSGSVLPSTGGIGTTIFYVLGGALMLGAAILLITKKRMASKG